MPNPASFLPARQRVYIRILGHTIVEAINRQLAHYVDHIGQLVYIGKMIKGVEWQSLSIPKDGSNAYNAKKFADPKYKSHFTDDLLDKPGASQA